MAANEKKEENAESTRGRKKELSKRLAIKKRERGRILQREENNSQEETKAERKSIGVLNEGYTVTEGCEYCSIFFS